MQVIKSRFIRVMAACVALSAVLASPATNAAAASAKGTASMPYKGKLGPNEKREALQRAKVNAMDRYIADFNDEPKERNYGIVRQQIVDAIDDYILGATVISESDDNGARLYTVVVRADINASKLENKLKDNSAMATTATADKSSIIFVFVARQQKTRQSFDDKIYRRTDVQQTDSANANLKRNTSEGEHVGKGKVTTADSASASYNAERNQSYAETTGGSTTAKADVVEWDLAQTADINTITTGVMTNAGYEVVDTDNLDPALMQAIRKDYSGSNDLSPATVQSLVAAAKALEIPYVAVGTLDVGMHDTDPATGNVRMYVKVNERVLKATGGKLFKTAAAVGPVDFQGLGPSEDIARTNALKQAARDAAQQLMNALNAKGVQ